jgi:GNAT superfamily N-acetyltransferase
MKVRQAILGEVPTIARVGVLAFAEDPSYGHFYPWRDQYPDDFYMHLVQKYTRLMVTPSCRIMVLELEEDDVDEEKKNGVGTVVAFVTLQRSGGTQEQQDKWGADSQTKSKFGFQVCLCAGILLTPFSASSEIHRGLLDLSDVLASPNRAVSQESLDKFWNQELAVHKSTGYTGKLDMLTLAVHPGFQRRGCGTRLTEWTLARAAQENLPVMADASASNLPLQQKFGFKVVGNIVQEEAIYKKIWCDKQLPPVEMKRLETPVTRWDAKNLSTEKMKEISDRATYSDD